MARHSSRGLDGRFSIGTKNAPEASEHDVKGIESSTELPFDDASVNARGPLDQPRRGPSADQISGGNGRRHAILIDGETGSKLGEIGLDELHSVLDRPSQKRLLHRYAAGEHDALQFLTSGE